MIDRLPIKAISVALVALVAWWLWPAHPERVSAQGAGGLVADVAAGDNVLASAIVPVDSSQSRLMAVQNNDTGEGFTQAPVQRLSDELVRKFERANALAATGQSELAAELYSEIIGAEQNIIEPYLNLAALHARQNNLDQAQRVLMQGLQTNERYGVLFASLQKVLGAMAANAYQDALEQEGERIGAVRLPTVKRLAVEQKQIALIDQLEQRLSALQSADQRADASAATADIEREKAADLAAELAQAKQQLAAMQKTHSEELEELTDKLSEQSTQTQNLIASSQRTKAEDMALLAAAQEASQQADQSRRSYETELRDERQKRERLEADLASARELVDKLQADQLTQTEVLAKQEEIARQQKLAHQEALARERELAQQRIAASDQSLVKQQQDAEEKELALQEAIRREQELARQQKLASDQALALKQKDAEEKEQALQEAIRREQELARQQKLASDQALALKQKDAEAKELALQQATAREQELARQNKLQREAAAQALAREQEIAAREAEAESVESQAVAKVESWASAWSRQAVQDYVDHYANDYASGGLGRDQWLEQRRVRLTNKAFINVTVSEFKVEPLADGFSVSFVQRYQSNTMDDTIRKRLTFATPDDDWAKAKIIGEQVMR